jgi:hypothetical protein
MRPRTVLAGGALTASLALLVLPGLAGPSGPTPTSSEAAAFQSIVLGSRLVQPGDLVGSAPAAQRSSGSLDATTSFAEPAPDALGVPGRATVRQPTASSGFEWKPGRYTLTGTATFYDDGTTAMRLPAGTIVRICGAGGCVERVVSDYGPFGEGRVVDLHRADFFTICGCPSWSGTTTVTVHVY